MKDWPPQSTSWNTWRWCQHQLPGFMQKWRHGPGWITNWCSCFRSTGLGECKASRSVNNLPSCFWSCLTCVFLMFLCISMVLFFQTCSLRVVRRTTFCGKLACWYRWRGFEFCRSLSTSHYAAVSPAANTSVECWLLSDFALGCLAFSCLHCSAKCDVEALFPWCSLTHLL